MNPKHWWDAYELRKLLALKAKIIADGGTPPTWLTTKINELEAE